MNAPRLVTVQREATELEGARTYTRDDVPALGLEAICHASDGVDYVWHGGCGLRVDTQDHTTTLVTNPANVPEGPWVATELGEEEIARDLSQPSDTGA
jgi:hypothetical protein